MAMNDKNKVMETVKAGPKKAKKFWNWASFCGEIEPQKILSTHCIGSKSEQIFLKAKIGRKH